LGYIPYGIPRAGTRTVEYSFDDWCIAQVAKGRGHDDIYQKYMARSGNWRNLWRSDYEWKGMRGFIMPRDAKGRWLDSVYHFYMCKHNIQGRWFRLYVVVEEYFH
jgi:putative alpha-1,2-mannosidase